MCDSIEGVRAISANKTNLRTNNTIPQENGVGLKKALPNFASWFKTEFLPGSEFQYPPSPYFSSFFFFFAFDFYSFFARAYLLELTLRSLSRLWV